jgi:hypothetical protein
MVFFGEEYGCRQREKAEAPLAATSVANIRNSLMLRSQEKRETVRLKEVGAPDNRIMAVAVLTPRNKDLESGT